MASYRNILYFRNTWTLPTKLNSTLTSPQVSRLQDDQLMSRSPGIYTPPRSISSESPNLRSYPNTRLSHNMRPSQDMTRPSQDFRTSPDIRTSHEIRTSHDIRTSHEIQATLHESEARRELLTHKLKDARDTIHVSTVKGNTWNTFCLKSFCNSGKYRRKIILSKWYK